MQAVLEPHRGRCSDRDGQRVERRTRALGAKPGVTSGPARRIRWGSVCGYACFYAFIVSIGLGATFHWRWLGLTYAFVYLGALVVGSAALLWRAWRHRHEPGGVVLGELAALPRSWRKWVLGEADDKPEA